LPVRDLEFAWNRNSSSNKFFMGIKGGHACRALSFRLLLALSEEMQLLPVSIRLIWVGLPTL
jgi:hypothetical protein